MKIIGLDLIKVHAERKDSFKPGASANTNIDYLNVEKHNIQDSKIGEVLKIHFKFVVDYTTANGKKEDKIAECEVQGHIFLSVSDEESKELMKTWKKEGFSTYVKSILFNFIAKKVVPKITELQIDLGLPSPFLRIPQVKVEKKE